MLFCPVHKALGALPYLGNITGRVAELRHSDTLDGIDDHHARRQCVKLAQDGIEVGLSQQEELIALYAQPLGAELNLVLRLLAGDVYGTASQLRYHGGDLEQEG